MIAGVPGRLSRFGARQAAEAPANEDAVRTRDETGTPHTTVAVTLRRTGAGLVKGSVLSQITTSRSGRVARRERAPGCGIPEPDLVVVEQT